MTVERAGLCDTCAHAQIITSSKGSTFVLCRQSDVDPSLRKYPMLPVMACHAYAQASTE